MEQKLVQEMRMEMRQFLYKYTDNEFIRKLLSEISEVESWRKQIQIFIKSKPSFAQSPHRNEELLLELFECLVQADFFIDRKLLQAIEECRNMIVSGKPYRHIVR